METECGSSCKSMHGLIQYNMFLLGSGSSELRSPVFTTQKHSANGKGQGSCSDLGICFDSHLLLTILQLASELECHTL